MIWTGLNDLFAENDTNKDQPIKTSDENRVTAEIQLETVDGND